MARRIFDAIFHDDIIEAFGDLTPEQRSEALEALRNAAPAARRAGLAPAEEGAAPAALSPEQRQTIQERREERREMAQQELRGFRDAAREQILAHVPSHARALGGGVTGAADIAL